MLRYVAGSTVSFTWVLDDNAARLARFSGPNPECCSGTLGWFQDFFSTTLHLWRSITGSGLTGAWQPPPDVDTSDVFLGAGTFPQPYTGGFGMQAQNLSRSSATSARSGPTARGAASSRSASTA